MVRHIDPPLPTPLKNLSAKRTPRRTGEVPIPQEEAGTGSPMRPRHRGPRGQEQKTERGGQLRENRRRAIEALPAGGAFLTPSFSHAPRWGVGCHLEEKRTRRRTPAGYIPGPGWPLAGQTAALLPVLWTLSPSARTEPSAWTSPATPEPPPHHSFPSSATEHSQLLAWSCTAQHSDHWSQWLLRLITMRQA